MVYTANVSLAAITSLAYSKQEIMSGGEDRFKVQGLFAVGKEVSPHRPNMWLLSLFSCSLVGLEFTIF